jgi:Domain of unknown function (DUF1839)
VTPVTVFAFAPIDPASYAPHELHRAQRAWTESNCYIDVWVEVLHAQGLDPLACLPFVLGIDFEGDQWTFFKPPLEDLSAMYGLEVQELNVWRPLVHHVVEQLKGGKIVLTESDSFYLPDTQGTDYRQNHVKTTIGIQEIDVEGRRLRYFHNRGYHQLSGDDFARTFHLDQPVEPTVLPLFAEFVRLDRVQRHGPQELVRRSLLLLGKHLGRRPASNPVARFKPRFIADVEWLKAEGLATFHGHAFATLRQLGAAFEFATEYLRWLGAHGQAGLEPTAAHFDAISENTKALVLKTARAVNTKRPVDFAPLLDSIGGSWQAGMDALAARFE